MALVYAVQPDRGTPVVVIAADVPASGVAKRVWLWHPTDSGWHEPDPRVASGTAIGLAFDPNGYEKVDETHASRIVGGWGHEWSHPPGVAA